VDISNKKDKKRETHNICVEQITGSIIKVEKEPKIELVCIYCKGQFYSKIDLFRHVKSFHSDINISFCSRCFLYFENTEQKLKHCKSFHTVSCIFCINSKCKNSFFVSSGIKSSLQENSQQGYFSMQLHVLSLFFQKPARIRKTRGSCSCEWQKNKMYLVQKDI